MIHFASMPPPMKFVDHARVDPDRLVLALALDRETRRQRLLLRVARVQRHAEKELNARLRLTQVVERRARRGHTDKGSERRQLLPSPTHGETLLSEKVPTG
jgi:hypothetical protein